MTGPSLTQASLLIKPLTSPLGASCLGLIPSPPQSSSAEPRSLPSKDRGKREAAGLLHPPPLRLRGSHSYGRALWL